MRELNRENPRALIDECDRLGHMTDPINYRG